MELMKKALMKTLLIAETLLLAGMLVVTTSPAFGVLTFDEDMEQYAVGTVIVTNTPTTIPGSSWFFQAFGGTAPNLPTATIIADPTGAGHGNVLDYINPAPASGTGWITSVDALGAAPSQNLMVEFDLYTVPHGDTSDQIQHTIETLARLTATDALIDGDVAEYAVDEGPGYVQLTTFNPGEWYHIREIAYGPGSSDGPPQTFDVRITRELDGSVVTNTTGLAWHFSRPDIQATKFGSIGRSGFEIYIDNLTINDEVPVTVPSTNVVVADTAGVSFQSKSNRTYRLQSTPDLVSTNFSDTGATAISDGGGMTLFDPAGTSTSKNYRVQHN
jgi:hypothetical protein